MCLWASNDVPLAGEGGQPQPRKLKDAAYGPIPADIVYFQPLWFTVDRALFWLKEPQRVPVSRITHGPPRFTESTETGQTARLMMTNPSSKDWPFMPILEAIKISRDQEIQLVIGDFEDGAKGKKGPQRH